MMEGLAMFIVAAFAAILFLCFAALAWFIGGTLIDVFRNGFPEFWQSVRELKDALIDAVKGPREDGSSTIDRALAKQQQEFRDQVKRNAEILNKKNKESR